jgi:hypothetical protein
MPYFSCRGYTSQSEMWIAGQRMIEHIQAGRAPVIFHFGDHDPSGKDMSRDIGDRLELFTGGGFKFTRLALNMNQIEKYNPPPNPAKLTDSRCQGYIAEFGGESWELDALEPRVIAALIRDNVSKLIDWEAWNARVTEIKEHQKILSLIPKKWDKVVKAVR